MSCPGPDLLLLLREGLLDDDDGDAGAVVEHVDGCDRCQAAQAALARALEAPPLPFDPEAELPAVLERIEALEAAAAAAAPPPTVRLRCTFCHDALEVERTLYCAACLAAHHGECFAEHGRCAAPGCEGRRVVRTSEPPP
ncbi:MAG: hypothetical protein KF878_05025, partial [Planctomycetes bacterium]|nr:hypothetical protein [Planctomycetota bacterium]